MHDSISCDVCNNITIIIRYHHQHRYTDARPTKQPIEHRH